MLSNSFCFSQEEDLTCFLDTDLKDDPKIKIMYTGENEMNIKLSIYSHQMVPEYRTFTLSKSNDIVELTIKHIAIPLEQQIQIGFKTFSFILIPGQESQLIISDDSKKPLTYASHRVINNYLTQKNNIAKGRSFNTTRELNDFQGEIDELYVTIDSLKDIDTKKLESAENLPEWFFTREKKEIHYKWEYLKERYTKRWIDLIEQKTVSYGDYSYLRNIDFMDNEAILSPHYYLYLQSAIYQELEDQYAKIDSTYYNLSFDEKRVFRSKRIKGDSVEIKNRIYDLDRLKGLLKPEIAELYGFFRANQGVYFLKHSDFIIEDLNYYFANYTNENYKKVISDHFEEKSLTSFDKGDEVFFDLVDADGKSHDQSVLLGKVSLIGFWFPGCKPCFEEFPFERQLEDRYGKNNFQVINIGMFSPSKKTIGLIDRFNVPGLNLFPVNDTIKKKLQDDFGVYAYPRYVLIDKQGRIIKNHALKPSSKQLSSFVEELIKK